MQMIKTNIYSWFETDQFETAIEYAEQNSSIEGVNHYLYELQELYQEYSDKMGTLLQEEEPTLDKEFYKWSRAERAKNICKWAIFISFVSDIFASFLKLPDTIFNIINSVFGLVLLLGIPFFILFKIGSKLLARRYNTHLTSVISSASSINNIYLRDASEYFNEIDDLYLNSLDPVHRETVLMRREQEKQHQERLRIEQERLRIEQQRLQSQKEMEDAQKRTLKASERILQIEEEREMRRQY